MRWPALVLHTFIASFAWADSSVVGSAYLRTLPAVRMPWGAVLHADAFSFEGVRIQRWSRDEPVHADWLTVTLDLQTPGLGYFMTPDNGPGPLDTYTQTTLAFVDEHDAVGLAINASSFGPVTPWSGDPVKLNETVWRDGPDSPGPPLPWLMLGLFPGRGMVDYAEPVRAAEPPLGFGSFGHYGAVHRGGIVGGENWRAPRNGVGVSADGRVLILAMCDGNEELGTGFHWFELAMVLQAAGATDGIFFDGGGSATMVARDSGGTPRVLNTPTGLLDLPKTLRPVALNLGFTGLQPTGEPLPAIYGGRGQPVLVAVALRYPWLAGGGALGLGLIATLITWLIRRWIRRRGRPRLARPHARL